MRINTLALLVSACFPAALMASPQANSVDEKIARLEASLAKAEAQIALLQQNQPAPMVSVETVAPATTPAAKLTLSGALLNK